MDIVKSTFDLFQHGPDGHLRPVFLNLDAEAFCHCSGLARFSMSQDNAVWSYSAPTRRRIKFRFNSTHPYMNSNALKYVLCIINRTARGCKILLELPEDFGFAIEVYQVLVVLQVEDVIDPAYGQIKQTIRERPLSRSESFILHSCLGRLDPKLCAFAAEEDERRREARKASNDSGNDPSSTTQGEQFDRVDDDGSVRDAANSNNIDNEKIEDGGTEVEATDGGESSANMYCHCQCHHSMAEGAEEDDRSCDTVDSDDPDDDDAVSIASGRFSEPGPYRETQKRQRRRSIF